LEDPVQLQHERQFIREKKLALLSLFDLFPLSFLKSNQKNSLPLKHEPGFTRTMKTVQIRQRRIIEGIKTPFTNSDSHRDDKNGADRKKGKKKTCYLNLI
jgi:hypothetical protein